MTSGDKATVAVLMVVGTILSGWALLELLTGFPDLVEWIKLGCGLLCYSGGCLMLLWPTLKTKRHAEPEPEPQRREAPKASVGIDVEGSNFKVEFVMRRRSYATLAAAILATGAALLYVAYYTGNFAALENGSTGYTVPIAAAVSGAFKIATICICLAAGAFWAGYLAPARPLVLAGAILAALCVVTVILWAIFSAPAMILGFVGYARVKKPHVQYVPKDENDE